MGTYDRPTEGTSFSSMEPATAMARVARHGRQERAGARQTSIGRPNGFGAPQVEGSTRCRMSADFQKRSSRFTFQT